MSRSCETCHPPPPQCTSRVPETASPSYLPSPQSPISTSPPDFVPTRVSPGLPSENQPARPLFLRASNRITISAHRHRPRILHQRLLPYRHQCELELRFVRHPPNLAFWLRLGQPSNSLGGPQQNTRTSTRLSASNFHLLATQFLTHNPIAAWKTNPGPSWCLRPSLLGIRCASPA